MRRAALAMALVLTALPVAARGNAQERTTIAVNQTVTRTYPAIIAANPVLKQHNDDLNQPSDPDPGTCASVPSCDLIPITVTQPKGLSVFDTFTLRIELRWDAVGANDLDLYLWYDPQGALPAKVARGTDMPEVITFPGPTSRDYQVVVANAAGANNGYTVKFVSTYVRGERPFESSDSATPALRPLEPAPPLTATTAAPLGPGTAPLTTTIDEAIDPDLGNLTAAGSAPRIFRDSATDTKPHRSVSSLAIVVWGVLAPLIVASVAGYLFYRRRPRALTFR